MRLHPDLGLHSYGRSSLDRTLKGELRHVIKRTLGRLHTLIFVGPRGWIDLTQAQLALLKWTVRKVGTPTGRFFSVARVQGRRLENPEPVLPSSLPDPDRRRIHELAWAVHQAARFGIGRPKCLVRSLALRDLLHRQGFPNAQVQLGVRKVEGEFQAHAWVELNGMVVGDAPSHVASFQKLPELFSGMDRNVPS